MKRIDNKVKVCFLTDSEMFFEKFRTEEQFDEDNFASGFKGITDIETGRDGYLYILSYLDGKLYRIVPYWRLLRFVMKNKVVSSLLRLDM